MARLPLKRLKVHSQAQGAQGDKSILGLVEFWKNAVRGRRENRCKRLRRSELWILGGTARVAARRRWVRKSLRKEKIGAFGKTGTGAAEAAEQTIPDTALIQDCAFFTRPLGWGAHTCHLPIANRLVLHHTIVSKNPNQLGGSACRG
jgi:hypothetical protein